MPILFFPIDFLLETRHIPTVKLLLPSQLMHFHYIIPLEGNVKTDRMVCITLISHESFERNNIIKIVVKLIIMQVYSIVMLIALQDLQYVQT